MTNRKPRSHQLIFCCLLASCAQPLLIARADEAAPAARGMHFILEDEPFVAEVPENYQPKEDLHYAAVIRGFAPLLLSDVSRAGSPSILPVDANGASTIAWLDSSPAGERLRKLMDTSKAAGWHRIKAMLIDDYDDKLAPPHGPHVLFNGHLVNAVMMLHNEATAFRTNSRNVVRFWRHFTPAREMDHEPLQEYALLAPSVEEAKQFAEDFLHAYDEAFVPWLRKFVEEQKAALEESRDEAQPQLAKIDEKIAAASREVEGIEQLGEAAISDLKVKRTLLIVELAGVRARIATIEQKLKDLRPQQSANERLNGKLVELKVSADIDLASLAAQQNVLDELIDGQRRLGEIAGLRQKRRPYADHIQTATEGLPRCDEILADLKPFKLVDETVVIRPLRFRVE